MTASAELRPTRGGRVIAIYAIMVAIVGFNRFSAPAGSLEATRLTLICLTGLVGGVALWRQRPIAQPLFLVWSALVASHLVYPPPIPEESGVLYRLAIAACLLTILVIVNREVARNVPPSATRHQLQ